MYFLITFLCFVFFSCVDEDESIDVTLKNDTESSVTFTYFSESIDENLPLSLESSKTRTVKYNAESLDFKVSYNDKLYSGTTNYVQDKSEYTINVFVENEVLKCKAAGNNSVTMTEISE